MRRGFHIINGQLNVRRQGKRVVVVVCHFENCLIHSGPKTSPLLRARTTPRTTAKYSHLSAALMLSKCESGLSRGHEWLTRFSMR
jgi:hypothetical protein